MYDLVVPAIDAVMLVQTPVDANNVAPLEFNILTRSVVEYVVARY